MNNDYKIITVLLTEKRVVEAIRHIVRKGMYSVTEVVGIIMQSRNINDAANTIYVSGDGHMSYNDIHECLHKVYDGVGVKNLIKVAKETRPVSDTAFRGGGLLIKMKVKR